MIHPDLLRGANAMRVTLAMAPESLPELTVSLAIGLELTRRELIAYLWENDGTASEDI
jgi:hypothetical protein